MCIAIGIAIGRTIGIAIGIAVGSAIGIAIGMAKCERYTVGTRIKVIPSFGKGTLPTLVFKVGGPQGYPSDLSPLCVIRDMLPKRSI